MAIVRGFVDVVHLLLEARADKDQAHHQNRGMTPLAIACEEGELKIVRLLLEAKADKNAPDDFGRKPLAHSSSPEVRMLLAAYPGQAHDARGRKVRAAHAVRSERCVKRARPS